MEQNENNKIETAREENEATTQMSHEEMQKKLKSLKSRQRMKIREWSWVCSGYSFSVFALDLFKIE